MEGYVSECFLAWCSTPVVSHFVLLYGFNKQNICELKGWCQVDLATFGKSQASCAQLF